MTPTSPAPNCAARGWRPAVAAPNLTARNSKAPPHPDLPRLPTRPEVLLCPWLHQGHSSWVTSVALSPDGRRLLSGSDDQPLRLWNAESGPQLRCCWATGARWFSLDMAPFQPGANFVTFAQPILRGCGPLPLACVEAIERPRAQGWRPAAASYSPVRRPFALHPRGEES